MTKEEALNILEGINADVEEGLGYDHEKWVAEVESICGDEEVEKFVRWVIEEIMDEDSWELNSDSFPEIACRKLEKLGYVEAKDGFWVVKEE